MVFLGEHPDPRAGYNDGLAYSGRPGYEPVSYAGNALLDEVRNCIGGRRGKAASLGSWARQGVLLLNRYVTCELEDPKAHYGMGWEYLCTEVVARLNLFHHDNLVFVLLGSELNQYAPMIEDRHTVIRLTSPYGNSSFKDQLPEGVMPIRNSGLFNHINDILGPTRAIDWRLQ